MRSALVRRVTTLALMVVLPLGGCATDDAAQPPTPPTPAPTATPAPVPEPSPKLERHEVRLLFTTDEHGWLHALTDEDTGLARGGVIELYDALQTKMDLARDDVILLSSGDNWTGPFESTVLEGAPMVAAFNHMNYRATAVGNHEFDFGTDALLKRSQEANFPFLAANIREAASQKTPAWAKPWTIIEAGGLKIGVVGLTFANATAVTDAKNLVGLEFQSYEEGLKRAVPAVREAGAEVVVVLLHDRMTEAQRLLPLLRQLGVSVVSAGHVHTAGLFVDDNGTPTISDDIAVCNAGAFMRTFCEVNVAMSGTTLAAIQARIHPVQRPKAAVVEKPDPQLTKIVEAARKNAEKLGGEVLAHAPKTIRRKGGTLGQLVVDTWLEALPYAQVAITNRGGLRQDLNRGRVRVRDVKSVLPFNNTLLVVDLSGKQLREVLSNPEGVVAGVRFSYQLDKSGNRVIRTLTDLDGKPIAEDARLKVVVNDFMYRGGDAFTLRALDPEPEETALDWREPLLRHLRGLGGSKKPLVRNPDGRALQVNL